MKTQSTARKSTGAAKVATANKPARQRRPLNLHDSSINPRGRVDVLVARGVKLLVEKAGNPVVQTLYKQFQPLVDKMIHRELRTFNLAGLEFPKGSVGTGRVQA